MKPKPDPADEFKEAHVEEDVESFYCEKRKKWVFLNKQGKEEKFDDYTFSLPPKRGELEAKTLSSDIHSEFAHVGSAVPSNKFNLLKRKKMNLNKKTGKEEK